jgi:hypothetical protein
MTRQDRPTFADIVRSERERPARTREPRLHPGRHGDLLVTADHRRWALVTEDLAPSDAVRLVHDGSLLAFDPCGCGGACGIEIIDPSTIADLDRAGPPTVSSDPRHPGSLSHWTSQEEPGTALVLAAGRVSWGRALA